MKRSNLSWMKSALLGALVLPGLRASAGDDFYDIAASTPARVVEASYFGTHLHRAVTSATSADRRTPWPEGQIGALRLWDAGTRWADLAPYRGAFRFQRLDAYVALAESHQTPLLMVLGSAPRWAAARPEEEGPYGPGSASEPAQLDDWDDYVAALARRYHGRIAYYELWNEPYFSDLAADRGHASAFFTGSVATLVELARRARAVLDREDPGAVLLTPGFVGSVQRLDMFLSAGGSRYIGGVAYHYYADDDRGFVKLHREIRAVMARHGLSRLPLFNTESGFAASDAEPDRSRAAVLLARSMLLGAYLGVDRFYQYAWDNGRSGMLLSASGVATPSAEAFAAVRRWLLGTRLLGCRHEAHALVHCRGSRDGQQLSIWWRAEGSGRVNLPAASLSLEYAVTPAQPLDLQGAITHGIAVGADPVAVWSRGESFHGETP